DMVVRALDDVDRVDLHIAQMLDGGAGRLRPGAEGRGRVEPLGVEPDAPRAGGLHLDGGSPACHGFLLQILSMGRNRRAKSMETGLREGPAAPGARTIG